MSGGICRGIIARRRDSRGLIWRPVAWADTVTAPAARGALKEMGLGGFAVTASGREGEFWYFRRFAEKSYATSSRHWAAH